MRLWLFLAGVDGALAVVMAAVGAHGVTLTDRPAHWFASASQLHGWHAIALIGVAALIRRANGAATTMINVAGALFVIGTILFSGTLYIQAIAGSAPLPMAAPAGGISLVAGWIALAAAAVPRGR